jgi:pyrroline-5-carboxylate reductase
MKIGFIGGGTMGEAILKGVISSGIAASGDIMVGDISQQRRDDLNETYNVGTTANNREVIEAAEYIVLAVKPQDLHTIASDFKGALAGQLVISIMAGVTLETLRKNLGHNYLVRAMPNMPAQIGEGITVWTATDDVTEQQKQSAQSIVSAIGEQVCVGSEKYIDMATALSGSGPAYIFLTMESLIDAGVHIGLPRAVAEKLVIETTRGSALALKETGKHPADLRNMVTSPGGTTAEGLLQLEEGGLRSLLLRSVIAAYNKAQELGKSA